MSASRYPGGRAMPSFLLIVACLAVSGHAQGEDRPLAGSATEAEIATLIRDLGDASFEKRTFATRRLCAIGMDAREPLAKAAAGDEFETALRARKILETVDALLFAGAEITLEMSKASFAWDEPLDLHVRLINRSKYPARVPFELDEKRRAALSANARQVGDMLDVGDLLRVSGPDGRCIELRVDEFLGAADVLAEVDSRLDAGPISMIGAGREATLIVKAFNRGWARYPLLDGGAYSLVLDYRPNWNDPVLNEQLVGRVVSNELVVKVSKAAPAAVSRVGIEAGLSLRMSDHNLIAELINRADQPIWVNRNFGPTPPFAWGRWVVEVDPLQQEIPTPAPANPTWGDFQSAQLVEVHPGAVVEMARIEVKALRAAVKQELKDAAPRNWRVHFRYSNVCDQRWQLSEDLIGSDVPGIPTVLKEPLPRRMLASVVASEAIELPAKD
ncbi:MAG: hypothetical protein JSV78_09775 [Phycisphaerales bacterium]|nr:MAG: hypothetical protein JSV78_09775 [Phycisphaerales bacterium]